MPDAVAKRIIDDEVAPHFQAGDFDAGLIAGVNAIITPTGKTVAEKTATWQQLKQEPDQDWLLRFSEGEYTFTDGPGRISPFVFQPVRAVQDPAPCALNRGAAKTQTHAQPAQAGR